MNKRSVKKLQIVTIILGVVFMTSIATGLIILNNNHSFEVNNSARKKIQKVFTDEKLQHSQKVISKYGFSLQYDTNIFTGEGHVLRKESDSKQYSADTYSDAELKESRAYAILRLKFKTRPEKSKKDENFSVSKIMPELSITTSRAKNYFDRSNMPDELKDVNKYSDLDLLLQGDINKRKKNDPNLKYHTSDVTISGLKFKKLVVDYGSSFDGKWQKTGDDTVYMTVQNGRPYWISIFALSRNSYMQPYINQLETLAASVTFQKPDERFLVGAGKNEMRLADVKLTQVTTENFSEDKNTTNTLERLDEGSVIKVVARNQIATVRVGSIRCADMTYVAQNGASMRLDGLCMEGVGSGSIVSEDGYIATNGHVTEIMNQGMIAGISTSEHWRQYLQFVVDAGYVTRRTLSDLAERAQSGDRTSLATIIGFIDQVPIDNIQSQNDRYDYVIQTSNDPITPDRSNPSDVRWRKTKTNIAARKIDAEVNLKAKAMDLNSDKRDVAVLKIDGRFPAVELGDSSGVIKGDRVTAIGYPAIVDDGSQTQKYKTVPTVTQGDVDGIASDAGGHKLFSMTAQIAAGNSGGPAFDADGRQIGLNTYGGTICENRGGQSNACFGRGAFRDIADLKDLARQNNITLSADGELTKLWKDGLNDFSQGKYSRAKEKFKELDRKYSDNYLVAKMISVASNTSDNSVEIDSPTEGVAIDERAGDTATMIVIIVISSTGFIFLVVAIIAIVITVANRRGQKVYYQSADWQHQQQIPTYQQSQYPSPHVQPQSSPVSYPTVTPEDSRQNNPPAQN